MEAGGENREKNKGSSDSIEAMQCDRRLRIIWRYTSLQSLSISGCHEAECSPDEKVMILPTTLNSSVAWEIAEIENLTSLEYLMIEDCPNLTSFPEVGLPSSLLQLIISKCPKLKTECKRDKGKEWSKIANIRRVETYGSDSVEESWCKRKDKGWSKIAWYCRDWMARFFPRNVENNTLDEAYWMLYQFKIQWELCFCYCNKSRFALIQSAEMTRQITPSSRI